MVAKDLVLNRFIQFSKLNSSYENNYKNLSIPEKHKGQREILIRGTVHNKSYTKILLTLCSIIATNTINWTLVCEVEAAAPKATPSAEFGKNET